MATQQVNEIIFKVTFDDKGKATYQIGKSTVAVKKFKSELEKAQAASKQLGRSLAEDMTSNAGLAGATLTELGRTISDSNYGIRGIANNLSQLSTLFITLVAKVDPAIKGMGRFRRAMSMIGAQLMGPLGIILVFQFLVQQLEKIGMESENAGAGLDDFAKRFASDSTLVINLRQAANTIKTASEESLSYKKALQDLIKEGYDPTIGKVEEFIKVKERLLQIDREETKNTKENIEDIVLQLTKAEQDLSAFEEKGFFGRNFQAGYDRFKGILGGDFSLLGTSVNAKKYEENLKNRIDILTTQLSIANGKIEDIGQNGDDVIENSEYLTLLTGKETNKESAVAKIIRKTTESIKKLTAESDKELLEIARDKALQEIELAKGTEEEKKKARMLVLQQFKIEVDALFEEQRQEEKERVAEIMESATDAYEEAVKKLNDSNKAATKQMQDTVIFNLRNQIKELNQMKQTTSQLFSSMTSVLTSLNDLQQSFHQANIDRINREKDLILQNDSLTQQEKDKRLKEIESREIAAEKRKIKSERDMFTLQQTLAISKALLDLKFFNQKMNLETMLLGFMAKKAVVEVGIDEQKNISGTIGTLPKWIQSLGAIAGPIAYGASIVGMIAAIVKARKTANNAIKNLVPSAGGGGGGGSAPGVQAPAFNVVGATQESQLAQAISGQDDKPIKAFVVASDVSTAQELERSTIEGASIG